MAIEDNKTNKRNNLLNASYELFTTIGFQNTTISKITTTANVGKGTFYLYFNNKDEIRHALIVEKSSHIIKNAIKILNEKLKMKKSIKFIILKICYLMVLVEMM